MDIPQAAKLLGRSLENLQLGRLQMQLGKMSDAQLLQIKNFKEAGKTALAQGIILDFVRGKVGGLSEAMAKTDSGKLQMAAKTLEEFKIHVGELVSKFLVSLIPAFNSVIASLKEFKEWVTGDSTGAEIFRDAVIALGGAVVLYTTYTTLATAAQWLFNAALWASGIPELILMVVGLAAAYMYLWDKVKIFREGVGGLFAVMKKWYTGLIELTVDLARVMSDLFLGNFDMAAKEGHKMFVDLKKDFTGWEDTWKGGSDKAANATFRFGHLFGLENTKGGLNMDAAGGLNMDAAGGLNMGAAGFGIDMALQALDLDLLGLIGKPGSGAGAFTQSAINTSALGGASGGLGEAKTIKIDFHKALMEINAPNANGQDIINKAPTAIEILLRIINNLTLTQGATM